MKIVNLEISSWAGHCLDAIHFYGCLKFYDFNDKYQKIELTRKITTKKEARFLSKKDGWEWDPDEETVRFNSEEDIIKLAIETYKEHCPDAEVLLKGSCGIVDPQEVLDGPEEFMIRGNEVYRISEEIGGYEGDEEQMEKISDEWMELIEWGD